MVRISSRENLGVNCHTTEINFIKVDIDPVKSTGGKAAHTRGKTCHLRLEKLKIILIQLFKMFRDGAGAAKGLAVDKVNSIFNVCNKIVVAADDVQGVGVILVQELVQQR